MKKLILVAVVSVALLFVGCKSENSNEVSRNTNKVETTAVPQQLTVKVDGNI